MRIDSSKRDPVDVRLTEVPAGSIVQFMVGDGISGLYYVIRCEDGSAVNDDGKIPVVNLETDQLEFVFAEINAFVEKDARLVLE